MAYIQIESSIRTHRKFMAAGPTAAWLWVCGLGYCQEGLTDGFIPDAAVPFLGVRGAKRLALELERVGLWERRPDGWQMHDYLDHNRAADDVRRIMRERAEGGRKGGRPRKETLKVNHKGSPLKGNLPRNPSYRPTVLPADQPADQDAHRARANDVEPVWRQGPRGHSPQAIGALKHHRCDPAAVNACARGLCVPAFLVGQWRAQLDPESQNAAETNGEIQAFVSSEVAQLPAGGIGDDPLAFWRAAWKARHGSQAPVVERQASTKGSRTLDAFDEAHEALQRSHENRR